MANELRFFYTEVTEITEKRRKKKEFFLLPFLPPFPLCENSY